MKNCQWNINLVTGGMISALGVAGQAINTGRAWNQLKPIF